MQGRSEGTHICTWKNTLAPFKIPTWCPKWTLTPRVRRSPMRVAGPRAGSSAPSDLPWGLEPSACAPRPRCARCNVLTRDCKVRTARRLMGSSLVGRAASVLNANAVSQNYRGIYHALAYTLDLPKEISNWDFQKIEYHSDLKSFDQSNQSEWIPERKYQGQNEELICIEI